MEDNCFFFVTFFCPFVVSLLIPCSSVARSPLLVAFRVLFHKQKTYILTQCPSPSTTTTTTTITITITITITTGTRSTSLFTMHRP